MKRRDFLRYLGMAAIASQIPFSASEAAVIKQYSRIKQPLMLATTHNSFPITYFVDSSIKKPGNGLSPETAFKSLGEALNKTHNSAVILIEGHTGDTTIDMGKNNVTLIGHDPSAPNLKWGPKGSNG